LGWAYGGNVPAFGTFYLEGLVSINTIIIKTGLNSQDHHLTHFAIEVQVGNEFKPVVITKVNVAKSKINENKVETNGEMNIRVAFETMSKVSAIKVHAFGSDASNENSVVNEIYALFLSDKYLHWVENDVDEILHEVGVEVTKQYPIINCESSTVQRDFECQHAFDGDTSKYHPQHTSFILGWAYGGNVPAFGTFYLEGLVSINTIIIKTGLNSQDHHLTHFAIEVQVGNEFKPVVITKVNVAKSKINENKVETNGEMNIRVAFETMSKVSAIKVHAFGSDASNENSVVNEIYALFLSDKYLHWVENDVDEILDEVHGDA